jgi:hypothetical protein
MVIEGSYRGRGRRRQELSGGGLAVLVGHAAGYEKDFRL